MPSSSPIIVSTIRRIATWHSFAPVWPVVATTMLLTIGLSLPWMQLYHPDFRGHTPFVQTAGGLKETLLWPMLGLGMTLLALVRIRYRVVWLVLLTLACSFYIWGSYDALQAWLYLNAIEHGQPPAERAPTAIAGVGLYLSGSGIVLTWVSIMRYRSTLGT